MKYQTKAEAMKHLSDNPAVAAKQTAMIDCMYGMDEQVSQSDLDLIALDVHRVAMAKVMSY